MRKTVDRSIMTLCIVATLLILAMLAAIIGNIVWYGAGQLSWGFLSRSPEGMIGGGVFPAIYGTVLLVLLMSIVAVPFGVVVAIYFAEYARKESWFYKITRMAVNNLAGVPSIVFGLFGLGFFIHGIGHGLDVALYGGQPLPGYLPTEAVCAPVAGVLRRDCAAGSHLKLPNCYGRVRPW